MAPPPAKKKSSRNRVVLAIGAVALLVLGYLWYQNRAGGSGTSPFSTGAASGQATPGAADTGSQGAAPDTSSADLLAALAGENQQLLGSLLSSAQGLRSLAGASLGAPTSSLTAGEPASATNFIPQAAVPDNQINVQPTASTANYSSPPDIITGPDISAAAATTASSPTLSGVEVTPASYTPSAPSFQSQISEPLGPVTSTVQYSPEVSQAASSIAGTFGGVFAPSVAEPASHPPSSAQHYTAQTGAIRAGRAG